MKCELIDQLSKLRKQSVEAVDNATDENIDDFKKYIHVKRNVEDELRELLKKVNSKNQKSLVLLCGSAGDGKSHLIYYFNSIDHEHLLDGYEKYNDATESSAPEKTAMETLAVRLQAFDDDHLEDGVNTKMIIAINLGTLNKFIDSEEGKKFSKLREYVESESILTNSTKKAEYKENGFFQHVSFADFQLFSLTSSGVDTTFLQNIFHKVFSEEAENPFYMASRECKKCPLNSFCVVNHNYQFMKRTNVQKSVINRLLEVVLKDKMIISTRDVFNLIFDSVVPPAFSPLNLSNNDIKDKDKMKNYINGTTPMLLSEVKDISPLMNQIQAHSVLKKRSQKIDNQIIKFHVTNNIEKYFNDVTLNTPYHEVTNLMQLNNFGNDVEAKKCVFQFIENITGMLSNIDLSQDFKEFINCIYLSTNQKYENELESFYTDAQKAIECWEGSFGENTICIDDSNKDYWLLESLELNQNPKENSEEKHDLDRFKPCINISFTPGEHEEASETVSIDYLLFKLIRNIGKGYRPTVKDKNYHAEFAGFVKKLSDQGKQNKQVMIRKKGNKDLKYIFKVKPGNKFEFKVEK